MPVSNIELAAQDSRVSPRWRLTFKVRFNWEGGEIEAFSTDVSASGMFIETTTSLPAGTRGRLEFEVAKGRHRESIEATGEVCRNVSVEQASAINVMPGLGIRFQALLLGGEVLLDLLEEHLQQQAGGVKQDRQSERRDKPRVDTGLPVLWGLQDPPDQHGMLTNLSASGAFLLVTEHVKKPGTRIFFQFKLPDFGVSRQVRAVARVIRTPRSSKGEILGMGVKFELSTAPENLIARFVDRRLLSGPPRRRQEQKNLGPSVDQQEDPGPDDPGRVHSWLGGLITNENEVRILWLIKAAGAVGLTFSLLLLLLLLRSR